MVPVDLPGKEKLLFEEPVDSIPGLARAVLPAVRAAVAGRRRIALFGHCFGAIVAYELARLLELEDGAAELVLFASGSAAPGRSLDPRGRSARRGPAASGRGERRGVGGHPEDPELRELILPALRADVTAHESYAPPRALPSRAPSSPCAVRTTRS